MSKKVTVFQYRLFHYRVELFQLMRTLCVDRGIDLKFGRWAALRES